MGNRETLGPIVSVIMPMYNAAPYLRESLRCITDQSLKDIEILCVDDGSDDDTLHIATSIAETDPRITVLQQEHNRQGAARNKGLAKCKGTFVYFFDSDDLLEKNALEVLSNKAAEEDLDIMLFNGDVFVEGEVDDFVKECEQKYFMRSHEYHGLYRGCDLWEEMNTNWDTNVSPCLQLFKRQFMEENHLRFEEGIIHEDDAFTVKAQMLATRVAVENSILFHRRIHPNSTVSSKQSFDSLYGTFVSAKVLLDFYFSDEGCEKSRLYALNHAAALSIFTRQAYKKKDVDLDAFLDGLNREDAMLFKMIMSW